MAKDPLIGRKQTAQERRLVRGDDDLRWVEEYEARILRDARLERSVVVRTAEPQPSKDELTEALLGRLVEVIAKTGGKPMSKEKNNERELAPAEELAMEAEIAEAKTAAIEEVHGIHVGIHEAESDMAQELERAEHEAGITSSEEKK